MSMSEDQTNHKDSVIIGEAQLILAEKRTSLATMRTGIAVCALPLSVISLLIATSRYYDVMHVLHILVPLGVLCALLLGLSGYLIFHAAAKLLHQDRLLNRLKSEHSKIAPFIA